MGYNEYLDLSRLQARTRINATTSKPNLSYEPSGTAIEVNVEPGGTLTASSDIVDGQVRTAFITLATGAMVDSSIKLLGYEDWPRDKEFVCNFFKRRGTVYICPVATIEAN